MITTGDLRTDLEVMTEKTIDRIVNTVKSRDPYHILIFSEWIGDTIRIKYRALRPKPPCLLGTCCFKITPKKGLKELLWAMPRDIPVADWMFSSDGVEFIKDSAERRNMPIIY